MLKRTRLMLVKLWVNPVLFLITVVAPIALVMVFLVPPFQAPDEHTHFFKAVQMSEGKLYGHRLGPTLTYPMPVVGDYLPARYSITTHHYFITNGHDKVSTAQIKRDIAHPSKDNRPILTPFENTVVYPPLAYAPQAVAIFLTNIMVKTPLIQMYAARIGSMVVVFALLFLAIRRMPFGKWGVVALAATPMSLLLAASCSGDAITAGLSVLFIAQVLAAIANRHKLSKNEIIQMLVVALALGLCKSPYELFSLFIFCIPTSRFKDKKTYVRTVGLAVAVPLVLAAAWAASVHGLYINAAVGSDTSLQAHYTAHHPLGFAHTLASTYFRDAGDYVPRDFIDLSAGLNAPMPLWFVALSYTFIGLVILAEPIKAATIAGGRYLRQSAALLFVIGFSAVNSLLYITFTPVGAKLINGLQGRYFIPFAYLLIPAVGGLLATGSRRYQKLLIYFRCFVLFTALISFATIVKRYY